MKKPLKNVLVLVLAFVICFAGACTTPKADYTVTFNAMGGSAVQSQTVSDGEKATEPATTRTGYSFKGWHKDEACTQPYSFDTAVKADITLYAKWAVLETYTVSFNTGAGSVVASQNIEEGQKAVKPANPTLAKYNFGGWYKDSGFTQSYDFNSIVTGNITLYAKWNPFPKYTVNFVTGGGSLVQDQLIDEGDLVTEPTDPTRENYEFDGWYYINNVDGLEEEELWNFEEFTVAANLTLTAHWNQTHYALAFNTNSDDIVVSQSIEFGGKGEEPGELTKEGYTFVGWYTSVAFTTKWNFDNVLDQDRTLYARWYENKTIDADLSDWSEEELENFVVCRAHNNANESRGWTLYAKYVKDAGLWIAGYADHNTVRAGSGEWYTQTNIEFKINGSSGYHITTAEQDAVPSGVAKKMITKEKATAGNEHFPNTYRSYWEVFFPENVVPNLVSGGPQRIGFAVATNSDSVAVGNRGAQVWWCNEGKDPNNSGNGYFIFDDVVGVNDAISSRGIFVNENRSPVTGTVTFNANGGSAVTPESVQIGKKLSKPIDPTRKDYAFAGWYKNSALTVEWDFNKDTVLQSYPLYAKWTPTAKYTVTFNTNGADTVTPDPVADIWVGSKIEVPSEPTRAGYVFMGWFVDDVTFENAWNFNTSTVTGNLTLYVKWVEIQTFAVTFETNGGTAITEQNIETGGLVSKPATTKNGHSLIGWYKDAEFKTAWNFATDKVDEAITLYARWYEMPETALYQSVSLRDADDKVRGLDVYAYVAPEGVYLTMIVYHNQTVKTNGDLWWQCTNAEFWINGAQHWASMRGTGEKDDKVTTMKYNTIAGVGAGIGTNWITTFEIFVAQNPSTEGIRMGFAVKPNGGDEQLKIAGFTTSNGLDGWWVVNNRTVPAQTDSSIKFSALGGDNQSTHFWVYSDGIFLNQKT